MVNPKPQIWTQDVTQENQLNNYCAGDSLVKQLCDLFFPLYILKDRYVFDKKDVLKMILLLGSQTSLWFSR
jgi:hypothetical protein